MREMLLQDILDDIKKNFGSIKFDTGTTGTQGKLENLPLAVLRVDKKYQRNININMLVKAKRVNWHLLHPVVVWKRPNGKYYIVDGQHKALMLYMATFGQGSIPCIVFEHPSDRSLEECAKEESKIFIQLNKNRTNAKTVDAYYAGLLNGDLEAVTMYNNLMKLGLVVEDRFGDVNGGTKLTGFTKLSDALDRYDIETVRSATYFLKDVYSNKWHLGHLDGKMIYGLSGVFHLMESQLGSSSVSKKRKGIQTFLYNVFHLHPVSSWRDNCSGNSDYVQIARRVVEKYHDALTMKVVDGSTIGETSMVNAGLGELK